MTIDEVLKTMASIPFSAQGHGVLWFMYTLIGLYLVTPILHAWLRKASEKEIRFYLLLWLVAMCYPLLQMFVLVNNTTTGILYYFSGYVGYFLLGYWMQRYGEKLSLKVAALIMCVSVFAPIELKIMHLEVDFYSLFWYLSVFVAIQCVFWWNTMKRLQIVLHMSDRVKSFITIFSNLSFGIYLSHIFIMRHFVWHISFVEHIKLFADYEIKECNEDNFDVNIIPYTQQAYEAKKYAFVSDYARFWILYHHGGVYFDTDVEVIRPMDDIIEKGPFMGREKGAFIKDICDNTITVQGDAGLGVAPGHRHGGGPRQRR